ncbi:MAG: hypothetical protein IPH84_03230 [Bacteroidales bacterium]|nr:hypothetical protein [Bacteroidales bacterium]
MHNTLGFASSDAPFCPMGYALTLPVFRSNQDPSCTFRIKTFPSLSSESAQTQSFLKAEFEEL